LRLLCGWLAASLLGIGSAWGQTVPEALASAPGREEPTAETQASEEEPFSFSLWAYTYFAPNSRNYVQPTVTADRDWLHLEARYNYEDFHTGSAWVGYNLSGGEDLAWELTPMVGGVFGDTGGVAPGYKGSLSWRSLEFSSEGEYVIDSRDSSDNFFYNWSELTLSPVEGIRVGLVTQRTRVYEADRDVQRGALVGFSWKGFDLAGYWFDPDEDDHAVVVAAGWSF